MESMAMSGGLMVWTLLTFGCLFLLLARFTFKPLRKILDEREARIRGMLDQAEKTRAEAEAALRRTDEQLAEAREESRRILQEGRKLAVEMKRESEEQARKEAGLIVSQAKSEIDREVQKSLEELKSTVAGLSIHIARQVLREQIDEKRHEQLAGEFIERLKKTHARNPSGS